jgi:hypothetical protein
MFYAAVNVDFYDIILGKIQLCLILLLLMF